ncbi:MAG: acyltransferase [Bacteroidaceae bacterium]|nr:acyltransferase [Bacteroidaceae bacterium]
MTDIHEFDGIRPFLPEELPEVYERLIADPRFEEAMQFVFPDTPYEQVAQLMRSCPTNYEFQKRCVYPMLKQLLVKASKGLTSDFSNITGNGYTFVSNHRDIVLDSALLDVTLVDQELDTVEIAIGDNLLIYPWIKDLVRVNRSFIVQRALTMRQMLMASAKMSKYMHYVVGEKGGNIWIAQREGRAKDSNDRTQDSVLKMLAMGGEGDLISRLKDLHIVPLAISYEFDPCDYLKAEEFQNKRDIEDFKKSKQDDLDNMRTGIFGYKGHIHYHAAPCINEWLDTIDPETPKSEIFHLVAQHIDEQIHAHYRLYPGNLVALQMLAERWPDAVEGVDLKELAKRVEVSEADRQAFLGYIMHQTEQIKIENPDNEFLLNRLLTMYAFPAINQLRN